MDAPTINLHSVVPVISTFDIQKSLTYYVNVLGFSLDFIYGDPPSYAGVRSGNAEIYFTHAADLAKTIIEQKLNPEVFLWIGDVNDLFNQHEKKGADIVEPVSDRPWGARQYVVRDINGYHLKFAQPL